nr:reverse transcriptase domain-containing protein [Tanacetum cinerariifolium]
MSVIANTTPIVTTVTKPATNPRDADATPRVNIQDFYEEYYEDILLIIMDKVRLDKAKIGRTSSKDHSRGISRPHRLDVSNEDRPENRERLCGIEELYDTSHCSYGTGINHEYRYHDRDRSRHIKRGRDIESPLSSVSKSDSSDGRNRKSKSKRNKPTNEDDLTMPWMCKEQKKYVKDPVEIHNIKQKDGETIEDFMKRFKVDTERMKGAPECRRISGFMSGVHNSKLTKLLNEHVPKTKEEMMVTTTAFIQGEAAAASKKKGHTSWRTQDQSKWQTSKKRFTPLTKIAKEILATEAGKFQPPPPMVTPVEKRSNNKFYNFHNDKGHSTNECMQLKKQIEELV